MEIDGFTNYLIFPNGLVFSKKKKIFLKHKISNGGYKYVLLYNKIKNKNKFIHRLVAEYFIDNPNNYNIVDHIDRNRLNNDINNLRWTTQRINCRNSKRKSKLGEKGVYKSGDYYISQITLSKTFNNINDANEYRNAVFMELNRTPKHDLANIYKNNQKKYNVSIILNKTYKTKQEALEGRKQLELKYYN